MNQWVSWQTTAVCRASNAANTITTWPPTLTSQQCPRRTPTQARRGITTNKWTRYGFSFPTESRPPPRRPSLLLVVPSFTTQCPASKGDVVVCSISQSSSLTSRNDTAPNTTLPNLWKPSQSLALKWKLSTIWIEETPKTTLISVSLSNR